MSDEPGWVSPNWDPTHPEAGGTPPVPPSSYPSPAQRPPAQPPPAQPPPAPPAQPGYSYQVPPGQYGNNYGYQPLVPKPGIIPLRPLGVGEILDGALSVVRQHWKIMIGLAAAVVSVTALIQFVLQVTVLRDAGSPFTFSSSFSTNFDSGASTQPVFRSGSGLGTLGFLGTTLLNWIAITVLSGIFTVIVSQAVLGQRVTLTDAWARVRLQIWPLIGLSFMSGLFLVLGYILCLIPGIYLYVALAVSSPVLVLERGRVFASMGRSRRLIENNWWRSAGILILAYLITALVTFVIAIPFVIIGGGSLFLSASSDGLSSGSFVFLEACTTVATIIAGAITYPFAAAIRALLYVDLRMRKEGLDIELMRAAGAAPPQHGQPGQYGQPGPYGQYGQYGQPPA